MKGARRMIRNLNGMGRGLLIAALLVVGLAIGGPAYADSYNFTIDQCTGGCGTAPIGTVTLTQLKLELKSGGSW